MDDNRLLELLEAYFSWKAKFKELRGEGFYPETFERDGHYRKQLTELICIEFSQEDYKSQREEFANAFQSIMKKLVMDGFSKAAPGKVYKSLSLKIHPDRASEILICCEKLSGIGAFAFMTNMKEQMEQIEEKFIFDDYLDVVARCNLETKEKISSLLCDSVYRKLDTIVSENNVTNVNNLIELLNVFLIRQKSLSSYQKLDRILQNTGSEQRVEEIITSAALQYKNDKEIGRLFPEPQPKDDIDHWIDMYEQELKIATDPTRILLLNQLVSLLNQIKEHQHETEKISSVPRTVFSGLLPYLMAGIPLGLITFNLSIVSMIAAISTVIDQSRHPLKESESFPMVAKIVDEFHKYNGYFANGAKTVVVSVLGLSFVACNIAWYAIDTSKFIYNSGMSLLWPLTVPSFGEFLKKNTFNYKFVAMIYYQIECYTIKQSNQFISWWRKGTSKSVTFGKTLDELKGIDCSVNDESEAINEIKQIVQRLSHNSILTGSGIEAKKLIQALQLYTGSIKPESVKLETELKALTGPASTMLQLTM